jgi:hypothetical protein
MPFARSISASQVTMSVSLRFGATIFDLQRFSQRFGPMDDVLEAARQFVPLNQVAIDGHECS